MSTTHPTSPVAMFGSLIHYRGLVWDLVKRDFIGRYKGSIMGVAWSLFNPLVMLTIYTLVFTVAFKSRWAPGEESKVNFAIILFVGLIVHGFFAECLNRAPGLIISHANYVKKVVFPLEILPVIALCSALLHFVVSLAVLLVFCIVAGIPVQGGVLLVPIVLLPLILITLGLSWLLASLGVYLRDLSQGMGIVTTVALFLAPVFYPTEGLAPAYRTLLALNPITIPIIQLRDLILWNRPLDWGLWAASLIASAPVCYIGYWWFQKSRRGFADVL